MPGNLDRILKGQKHAFAGGLFRLHVQQIFAVEEHFALGHVVGFAARQHLRQRALARSVRAHDGMHFAGIDRQVNALENFVAIDLGVQILDFQ